MNNSDGWSRTSCQVDEVLAVLMAGAKSKLTYIVLLLINNMKSDRRQRLASI